MSSVHTENPVSSINGLKARQQKQGLTTIVMAVGLSAFAAAGIGALAIAGVPWPSVHSSGPDAAPQVTAPAFEYFPAQFTNTATGLPEQHIQAF